jgi:Tol biopolymer transport system component
MKGNDPMPLEAGSKLGPYEVISPTGAGGMGEVYQAKDTRLDRMVAIKVLPHHLSENEELRQRFDREARTISNLSHPHICALYDVGHEDGVDYLVMEYLEGETLAARIAREPLPPEDVLKYGIQVCDALETAHRGGVIHRDLKPGNVMITRAGAKLLDFGLAKLADTGGDVVNSTLTAMATRPHSGEPLTGEGTIMGTFQYMAPEQLEGKAVDARADVFALGAMLYEMATGKKAFDGGSQASLIAAILERTPPSIAAVQPMAPPALDHVVRACLAKDPDERIQTAHDVRLQLQWIVEGGSQVGVPAAVASHRRRTSRLAWVLAAVFGVVAASLAAMTLLRSSPQPVALAAQISLVDVDPIVFSAGGSYAISPDGRRLVVSARETEGGLSLWVRDLVRGDERRLPGTERGFFPFWSPDGRHIGFFTEGKLKRIEADGGSAVTICDVGDGRGGSWSADGTIIFGYSTTDGLYRVAAGGGTPAVLTEPDSTSGIGDHRFPWFLPDGKHFLFTARGQEVAYLCAGSLNGGEVKRLLPIRSNGVYVDGHILYVRENTLVARPFDPGSLEFTGDATIVAEPVHRHDGYTHGSFSVSSTGVVIYGASPTARGYNINVYDRDGKQADTIISEGFLDDITLSGDGRTLAVARPGGEASGLEVWTYDLERRIFTRVSFDGGDDPVFSPDGTRIANSTQGELVLRRSSGAGEVETLYESPNDDLPADWSRDGTRILFLSISGETSEDIWVYNTESRQAEALLASTYREMHPQFSPDGRWIAYTSTESSRDQVYIIDYPGLAQKVQVSRDGGQMPRWRQDGRELYFISASDSMTALGVSEAGDRLRLGRAHTLFHATTGAARTHQYAVAPDGSRFYVLESANNEEEELFQVLVGWPEVTRR